MRVADIQTLFNTGKMLRLGDFELEVKKLGTDDAPLLMEFQALPKDEDGSPMPSPKLGELIKRLTAATLRRSIEDASDTDNLELPMDDTMRLFEAVMEVNKKTFGETDEQKAAFIERIKASQK